MAFNVAFILTMVYLFGTIMCQFCVEEAEPGFSSIISNTTMWFFHQILHIQSSSLKVAQSETHGTGVYAAADIKAGDLLLHLPPQAIYTCEVFASRASKFLGRSNPHVSPAEWTSKLLSIINTTECLALALLNEKYNFDQLDSTEWKIYVESLPSSFSTPLFWPQQTLNQLSPSNVLTEIVALKTQTREDYDKLIRFCEQEPISGQLIWKQTTGEHFTFEEYMWAVMATLSRVFRVRISEEASWGLAPFADLFNFIPRKESNIHHSMDENGLKIRASRAIIKHEQIFAPYGKEELSNAVFLVSYGFAAPDYSQDWLWVDANSLWDLIFTNSQKRGLIEDLFGHSPVSLLQLSKADPLPWELLLFARVQCLTDTDFEDQVSVQKLYNPMKEIVSRQNEKCAVRQALVFLDNLLALYVSEEQRAEMKGSSWHEALAATFLETEIEILQLHEDNLYIYKRGLI